MTQKSMFQRFRDWACGWYVWASLAGALPLDVGIVAFALWCCVVLGVCGSINGCAAFDNPNVDKTAADLAAACRDVQRATEATCALTGRACADAGAD